MIAKVLYPDIVWFRLLKELPGVEAGEMVTIIDADGRECLIVKGIQLSIYLAQECPDWFEPVDTAEHQKICRESTIKYIQDVYGKTKQEAIDAIKTMGSLNE